MISKRILHGAISGLAGGLAFGVTLGMLGMLPMVGQLIGIPTLGAGFLVHMAISAIIGAGFGVLLGRLDRGPYTGVVYGLGYGFIWWMLGPLTLMPFFLGMGLGVNWNAEAVASSLPSLAGHLVYGGIVGVVYSMFQVSSGEPEEAPAVVRGR